MFSFLQEYNVPWKASNITTELDMLYHGDYGERYVSPLVTKQLNSEGVLTDEKGMSLAKVLFAIYNERWINLYNTLSFDYNPIENYSMLETHTGSETGKQTPTDWKKTETQTTTDWKTKEIQTPTDWETTTSSSSADNKAETSRSIYGFNSTEGVPTDETTSTVNSKNTVVQNGTYDTERVQSGTFNTESVQSGTFEDKKTYDTTLSRSGNIGTTTTQDMIQQEREVWEYVYFLEVFKDINKLLTLSIY